MVSFRKTFSLSGDYTSSSDPLSDISLQHINEAKTGDEIYLSIYEEPDEKGVFNKLTNQNGELIAMVRITY